ncbi:MAG: heme biosynthesis protein HemY [Hoeflea sp.]|nr:heme biosynthesis protein HemY [Alphaproteobacteria bacterium]MBV1725125.1 heme biosynthesis protein HemY [Hoeflea sp.]MBU4544705.1 heme biosynthesis protein HemY [Alphaproteobacteria bacterium]MBU4552936.1 heme biosynthesis protein HemY [Alphaproteobacteria bacterium]MBV1761145.1 heme biosynthesis protein HemY [Hoeflea sp.]
MIRLLIFVVLVLALGFGFAWLADRPGDLFIVWQDRRIEMSLMTAVTVIASLIAAIMISWWLVRTIIYSPRAVSRYFRASKRDRGYQALSTGLLAAGAGDAAMARKMNKRTKGLLNADQEPLIHLLDVQAALIEGRHEEARKLFEAMAKDPETRLLGLRGLYLEAQRQGADDAAQHYAETAAEQAPQLPWAASAALSYRTREGKWNEALSLLDKQRHAGTVEAAVADRTKAVLLTARARDHSDSDPSMARDDALAALKLAPAFSPAVIVATKALLRQDNLRKAAKILETAWKANPHPDIAEAYVRARIGDTAADRLKRAERLEKLKPLNPHSLEAVARAALDAHRFDLAREKAEAAARMQPCEGIYLLLADIEEAETGDQGRVRHWLSQAVRAPRDPAWTADGYVSETWEPVSPVTGKLDAFEWKVPVEQLAGPSLDNQPPEQGFERAIATLPPVRIQEKPAPAPAPVAVASVAPAPAASAAETKAAAPKPAAAPVARVQDAPAPPPAAEPDKAPEMEPKPDQKAQADSRPIAAKPMEAKPVEAKPVDLKPVEAKPVEEKSDAKKDDAVVQRVLIASNTIKAPEGRSGTGKEDQTAQQAVESLDKAKTINASEPVDPEAEARAREEAFLTHRPDDPGIDVNAEPEKPGRFRLF